MVNDYYIVISSVEVGKGGLARLALLIYYIMTYYIVLKMLPNQYECISNLFDGQRPTVCDGFEL